MDPGNWATDLAGGSRFGYTLLSVVLVSNIMAVLLQGLASKLGIVTGRDLAQACRDHYSKPTAIVALGALRDRDRRVRSGRGHRIGDRAEPPVPSADRGRRARHRLRRPVATGSPESRDSRPRGAGHYAHRVGRTLLLVRDRSRPPERRRAGQRIRADRGHRSQPRDALHRHRHPRRDGDAAQPLSALVDRADAPVRRDERGTAGGRAVRVSRLDDRAELRVLRQRGDSRRGGQHVPHVRTRRSRRDPGRAQAAHPVARRRSQHRVCARAPRLGAEFDRHRHPRRSDRDGGLSQHPIAALAPPPDHPGDRHCPGRYRRHLLRRTRHRKVADPQPGDSELAALVRGLSPRRVHVRSRQDGRVRQRDLAQGGRVDDGAGDRGPQRVAARANRARVVRGGGV